MALAKQGAGGGGGGSFPPSNRRQWSLIKQKYINYLDTKCTAVQLIKLKLYCNTINDFPKTNKMAERYFNSLTRKLLQRFYLPTPKQYGEYVIEFKSFHQNGNISETVA